MGGKFWRVTGEVFIGAGFAVLVAVMVDSCHLTQGEIFLEHWRVILMAGIVMGVGAYVRGSG